MAEPDPTAASSRRSVAWTVLAIALTAGLYGFFWIGAAAWRILDRRERGLVSLVPACAGLWLSGSLLMVRGALLPTQPGVSGNPVFLAGFVMGLTGLVLMVAFVNAFTRRFTNAGDDRPLRVRLGLAAALLSLVLLGQLVREVSPISEDNSFTVFLIQLLSAMGAAVLGIHWMERAAPLIDEKRASSARERTSTQSTVAGSPANLH